VKCCTHDCNQGRDCPLRVCRRLTIKPLALEVLAAIARRKTMDDLVDRLRRAKNITLRVGALYRMADEAADRIEVLETRVAAADKVMEAHNNLWRALAEIIEAPGVSPNATVRRMAARAEKALVEDAIADVKPAPRFYREEGRP
jgi:uncharacterized coiled-coil protein SlyX